MEFSQQEKMAFVKIITDLIKADGVLHKSEMKMLEQLKKLLHVTIPEVEASEDLDLEFAFSMIKKMSSNKKKLLIKSMNNVAISDNHVHEAEKKLIDTVIKQINLQG